MVTGFKVEHVAGDVAYGVIGSEVGVDELDVDVGTDGMEGFSYFHNKFGIPYNFFFKKTISSGHILAVAVLKPNKLIAFARFEMLDDKVEQIYNGKLKTVKSPLLLLRSIEVHSSYRKKGIGMVLFTLMARNLCADILTKPDNLKAEHFFRNKLMFGDLDRICGLDPIKYPNHLIISNAKSAILFSDVTKRYTRMVLPELMDGYEALQFKVNMGKNVILEDVYKFEIDLNKYGNLLDDGLQNKMSKLLTKTLESV